LRVRGTAIDAIRQRRLHFRKSGEGKTKRGFRGGTKHGMNLSLPSLRQGKVRFKGEGVLTKEKGRGPRGDWEIPTLTLLTVHSFKRASISPVTKKEKECRRDGEKSDGAEREKREGYTDRQLCPGITLGGGVPFTRRSEKRVTRKGRGRKLAGSVRRGKEGQKQGIIKYALSPRKDSSTRKERKEVHP